MSTSDKDRFGYFLHSGDSRLWRFDIDTGFVAFFGGQHANDWRIFNRAPFTFVSVDKWEEFSGTPVVVVLKKSGRRRRKRVK